MVSINGHFISGYIHEFIELLHRTLDPTWFYKSEIIEIPELLTAILITYDDQEDDDINVNAECDWENFLERMSRIKSDWAYFDKKNIELLVEKPEKTIGGWEGRTIYLLRGGQNPEYWKRERAFEDIYYLLSLREEVIGPLILEPLKNLHRLIPVGPEHYRDYEYRVRVTWNYLFYDKLGEAKYQVRTEPGNEGLEIRDLLCSNNADSGFFKDIKNQYNCSHILIDAKNTRDVTRDDLRQIYCYLKGAIGYWGIIVSRGIPQNIIAYNRTLFKNFNQERGILILEDRDLRRMVEIKNSGRNPTEYLRSKWSAFVRTI